MELNELIVIETVRPNGTVRIQKDYKNCPTLTEQHSAHLTDLNYLIKKYQPDELAAYLAVRSQYRTEITGHDFSKEPNLQEAKNTIYAFSEWFKTLDPKIKGNFKSHVDFLKFIDNPANAAKLVELGLVTVEDVKKIQSLEPAKVEPTEAPAT